MFNVITVVQIPLCSPSQLDCVEKVTVGKEECLEKCQGTIMHLEKLPNSVRDEDGLATFIREYEEYKDPHNANWDYPDAMKGAISVFPHCIHLCSADLRFSSRLKYVQISILTSTFDRISKEQRGSVKL